MGAVIQGKRGKKHYLKVIAFNIALLIVLLAGVEFSFGNWLGNHPLLRLNVPRDLDITIPLTYRYPHRHGEVRYRRDKFGLRGMYPNPRRIDILTIGGSTTAQSFVSEGQTWQDVLHALWERDGKTVYVANAGVDGQSTFGHIRDFRLWFSCIPGLRPRYILSYVGINDTEVPGGFYADRLEDTPSWKVVIKRNSALWLIYQKLAGIYRKRQAMSFQVTQPLPDSFQWTGPVSLSEEAQAHVDAKVRSYERRLRRLIKKIRAWGATPILVTQTTPTFRKENGSVMAYRYLSFDGKEYQSDDFEYTLDLINRKTCEVARATGVRCIDLASELRLGIDECYDIMHTNPKGSRKVGAYLYGKLKGLW